MKSFKKKLLTFFATTTLASTLALTSCDSNVNIEFNVDGGTLDSTKLSVKQGEDVSLPTPTKEGYTFVGWYKTADLTGDAITTVSASENMTFYAKWVKNYTVTFKLNGSTLSGGETSIEVGVGLSLNDALKNYTPTLSNLKFAGWYLNDTLISSTTTMPENDIEVVAKFGQTYTINYYLNKLNSTSSSTEYELYSSESKTAFVGDTVTANSEEFIGGTFVSSNTNNKTSCVISSNPESNVLSLYYTRNEYTVTFNSNYTSIDDSGSTTNKTSVATVSFGQTLPFPDSFSYEGYEIVGWARGANSDVVYANFSIENDLFNDDEKITEQPKYTADRNATLYAIWAKAYTDVDGNSDDQIYVFDAQYFDSSAEEGAKIVYLKRGGVYFKGTYDSGKDEFKFDNAAGEEVLYGNIVDDSTFKYYDSSTSGLAYKFYDMSTGEVSSTITIQFNGLNGVTYRDGTKTSTGTYTYSSSSNEYTATFTTGELAGQTKVFQTATSNSTLAFVFRNDEDVERGTLPVYNLNSSFELKASSYSVTLDGYGTTSLAGTSYYYQIGTEESVGEYLGLYTSGASSFSYVLLEREIDGVKCYVIYNASTNITIESADKTAETTKFVLDGTYGAKVTYSKNGGEVSEDTYYYFESINLAYGLLHVKYDGVSYSYLVYVEQNTDNTYSYTYKKVNASYYHEYLYFGSSKVYYYPMFVTESASEASLYGYTSDGDFVKVSTGTYVYDSTSKQYTYTATTEYSDALDECLTTVINLSGITKVVFKTYTTSSRDTTYWLSYERTVDGKTTTTELGTKYTFSGDDAGKYLKLVGPDSLYYDGTTETSISPTNHASGTDSDGNSYYVVSFTVGKETKYVYITENTETKLYTAEFCKQAPTTYYLYENNESNRNVTLVTDKNGNVTYTTETATYTGTIKDKGTKYTLNSSNSYIEYEFVSTDETVKFQFIVVTSNSTNFFLKYDETYVGDYKLNSNYTVHLDGYGYYATLGTDYYGYYIEDGKQYKSDSNTYVDVKRIVLVNTSYSFEYRFDINSDHTVTMIGTECGTFKVIDNATYKYEMTFDGYEHEVKIAKTDSTGKVLDEDVITGTYSQGTDYAYTIEFTDDGKKYTLKGDLMTYSSSSGYTTMLVIIHTDVSYVFVNEDDWTVFDFDEHGNASFYDNHGEESSGMYTIISDELLYYTASSTSGSDVLVKYDISTLTYEIVTTKGYSYYTSDLLNSIVLEKDGTISINGTDGFYSISDDKVVTVYTLDSKNGNEYGFKEETLCTIGENYTIDGKTYQYFAGSALPFDRTDENKDKYPIIYTDNSKKKFTSLNFAPKGEEFEVDGVITLDGKAYNCVVSRVKDASTTTGYKTTVLVGDSILLTIELSFKLDSDGLSASTYEVTGLSFVYDYSSYDAIYLIYLYYSYYGYDLSSYKDMYGKVTFYVECGEDGEANGTQYATSTLDTETLDYFVDSNNKPLTFENVSFKTVTYSSTRFYVVETTGSDGFTYKFYMNVASLTTSTTLTGINVAFVSRVKEFTTNDDYTVTVEEIVSYGGECEVNEDNENIGTVLSVAIKDKDGNSVPTYDLIEENGTYYVVSRDITYTYEVASTFDAKKYYYTKDGEEYTRVTLTKTEWDSNEAKTEGKVSYYVMTNATLNSTTLYSVKFTTEAVKATRDDKQVDLAPLYTGVEFNVITNANTYFETDFFNAKSMLLVLDNKILSFTYDGEEISDYEYTYDVETKTWTVTVDSDTTTTTYTIVLGESGYVTITKTSTAK